MGFQCISNYLIDAYTGRAASTFGAVIFQRGCTGFGFPLFTPYMYAKLSYR
jgi:hypothetical protein